MLVLINDDEIRDERCNWRWDEMRDEMRDEIRWEMRWEINWEMRWDERWDEGWDEKLEEGWLLAQIVTSKWSIFLHARAALIGKYSSILTNGLIGNIPLKKKTFLMNAMILNMAYSFEKHRKPPKNSEKLHFFGSRPKLAVFQIFQDRFFWVPLISIQRGLVKAFILVPPRLASKSLISVSSYGWSKHQEIVLRLT